MKAFAYENCEYCNGEGFTTETDYVEEVTWKKPCFCCLALERDMDDLTLELTKLLSNASPQKLANIVANLLVLVAFRNDKNFDELTNITQTKNTQTALILAEMYAYWK